MRLPTPRWTGSEEDHAFRSQVIQWLLHNNPGGTPQQATIPKVIMQFWDNLNEIPRDVAACMGSWQKALTAGFKIELFDALTARVFITAHFTKDHVRAFDLCYHPAMQCDYFRLCYIWECGGFYVDADDVYKGTPIAWLFKDGRMKLNPMAHGNRRTLAHEECLYNTDWPQSAYFYLNNSPFIAPPRHPIVGFALERATRHVLTIEKPAIHESTGPGSMTAAVVRRTCQLMLLGEPLDFMILRNWPDIAQPKWALAYRRTWRDWRQTTR